MQKKQNLSIPVNKIIIDVLKSNPNITTKTKLRSILNDTELKQVYTTIDYVFKINLYEHIKNLDITADDLYKDVAYFLLIKNHKKHAKERRNLKISSKDRMWSNQIRINFKELVLNGLLQYCAVGNSVYDAKLNPENVQDIAKIIENSFGIIVSIDDLKNINTVIDLCIFVLKKRMEKLHVHTKYKAVNDYQK